jgi:metal-responsive CopG/Arc/MetJ family transcriptional regulator
MVINSTDHHCLEVIVSFVDICRIDDHHCLEVIVSLSDIGRIDESPLNSDGHQFYQYQQN